MYNHVSFAAHIICVAVRKFVFVLNVYLKSRKRKQIPLSFKQLGEREG